MGRIFEVRKATMFKRFDRMAKQFTRIGKEIVIAVKASGPNPDDNPALRRCYQNARSVGMPKDRVEAAIKRAMGKDTSNYDAPVDEYAFDQMYPEDPGPFEEGVCPVCGQSPCTCTMEVRKFQEIAGVKSHDDGPEDDDSEAREKRADREEEEMLTGLLMYGGM